MPKRTHEMGVSPAARGLSSLYASADNESHRKPGAGHGEGRRKRRPVAIETSTPTVPPPTRESKPVPTTNGRAEQDATEQRRETNQPALYRKPARKH